jgi:hypothetical protein
MNEKDVYGKEEDIEELEADEKELKLVTSAEGTMNLDPNPAMRLSFFPPNIAKCSFENNVDIEIQSPKWPSWWFRFWTKIFFGAKWERI